ncbi:MAG: penicillin-binding protein family [Bacteriovoracaceae bacterium]|nr:penicillin-binding protein family [Bacteriovoracaceae bacterium]
MEIQATKKPEPTPEDKRALRKRTWRRLIRIASIFSAFILAGFLSVAFLVMIVLNKGLPSLDTLKTYEPQEVTEVFSSHGEVIGEFYNKKRFVVKEFPDLIKHAFIAAEDSHFYTHKGVNFLGMMRATYVNLTQGGYKQGASTITQQVVRGLLLTPEKTFSRKIREIILAWQIEKNLTKDEILYLYLNHIYLGNGAYGVKAAARVYFGKELNEITIAEAAILGGLPQAPSRYSPSKNPDRVKRRQLYVLHQMLKQGFINQTEHDIAGKQVVYVEPPVEVYKGIAPYFTEAIRQYLMNKYGAAAILDGGYQVYTTLDVDMNRYAQNAVRKGLSELEKRQGYRGSIKHLTANEMKEYFKGREFEEFEDENVVANKELEVAATEAKEAGKILMKRPKGLEVGDWLEGLVQKVDDEKQEALVEYTPNLFAQIAYADLKWAHSRIKEDDDEAVVQPVKKVSDVLKVGDVISMSVKKLNADPEKPIEGLLEQATEVEGALLSVDPHTGYVLSMVGGNDFNRSQFNRAMQAKRQPGSAFKPIVYAAAIDMGLTPASRLQDSPITFENAADQEKWRPHNFDEKFKGDITLRTSLLESRNITTIKLLNEVGIDTVIEYARRLGIESPLQRDFTLALGSSALPMPEIIQPYIIMANGGYKRKLVMIKKIVDRNGNVVEENVNEDFSASTIDSIRSAVGDLKKEIASVELAKIPPKDDEKDDSASFLQEADSKAKIKRQVVTSPLKPGQSLSSEASFLMANLLKENILYGTGMNARALDRPAAGKTGTTEENRDAWFIGFTPQMVTAVWVGFDDERVLGKNETGHRAAVPIWLEYMSKATAPYPKTDFTVPENIDFARIDPKTGGLASTKTKDAVFEAFLKGTAPTKEIEKPVDSIDLYQVDQ